MVERLENVSVYVHPIKNTNNIRIFEISNESCGKSRFSDVERNTGKEIIEYSSNSGSPNILKHEEIKRYLMGSAGDYLILKRLWRRRAG